MSDDQRDAIIRKIARRLRAARTARRLPPQELAARAGLSLRRLERYEAGQARISVDELEQVAAGLRLPVSHFLEGCALCGDE